MCHANYDILGRKQNLQINEIPCTGFPTVTAQLDFHLNLCRLHACWNWFTLGLVIHIIYIAFLAYITTDNAELTGNSTTTNVRFEL